MLQDRSTLPRVKECLPRQARFAALLLRVSLALLVLGLSCRICGTAQQLPTAASAVQASPVFEVASIKPGKPGATGRDWDQDSDRLTIGNYTLKGLIAAAYDLKSRYQVLGGPEWLDKLHYDISAVVDEAKIAQMKSLSPRDVRKEWLTMLQALLADRFGLKVSAGQKTLPVYLLVVSKSGPKLTLADPNEKSGSFNVHNSHMEATDVSLDSLAVHLSRTPECDRIVMNRSNLTGKYTFTMDWTRDPGDGAASDAKYPGLFTALREQLGLELKPDKGPVDVVIVQAARVPDFD